MIKVSHRGPKSNPWATSQLPTPCRTRVSSLTREAEWEHGTPTPGEVRSTYTLWSYPPHGKAYWICEGQTEEFLVISSLPHKSVINLQIYFLWDGVPGSRVLKAITWGFQVLKHPGKKKSKRLFVDYAFSISIFLTSPASSLPAALVWLSKAEFAGFKFSQSKQTKNWGNDLS